jgi:predicted phage-related endonuclease
MHFLTDDHDLQTTHPEEWLRLRQGGLGGSDIPKLCWAWGDDPGPLNTPLAVYRSKVEAPEPPGRELDNVEAAVGRHAEPLLARMFTEATGLETRTAPMACDPERPWRRGCPDRLVIFDGEPAGVLELKRPVAFNRSWSKDDPPLFARMQVQWYADILGLNRCCIFALTSDVTPRLWSFPADPELAAMMTEVGEAFWRDHVEARVPPPPAPCEVRGWLGEQHPEVTGEIREATIPEIGLCERIVRCTDKVKLFEGRKKELTDELIASLQGAEGVEWSGGRFTWRPNKNGTRVPRMWRSG